MPANGRTTTHAPALKPELMRRSAADMQDVIVILKSQGSLLDRHLEPYYGALAS